MAGVEAYAELIAELYAVDDFPQFFKTSPDLRAFARHCFEKNRRLHFGEKSGIQRFGNQLNPFFLSLTGMRAGVEVIAAVGEVFHPLDILLQHIEPVCPGGLVGCAQIHGVAAVSDQFTKMIFFEQSIQSRRIFGNDLL